MKFKAMIPIQQQIDIWKNRFEETLKAYTKTKITRVTKIYQLVKEKGEN